MNLSEMVTRVKLKLGLFNIVTPIEDLDSVITQIITDISLPVFSIYQPARETIYMNTSDMQLVEKTAEYERYLLPDFRARKLLYVLDVRYDTGQLSGLGSYGAMPMLEGGLFKQMMLSNAGAQLYNQMIPKLTYTYQKPRDLFIYNIFSTTKIVLELGFEHDKSLGSVPETARESLMDLIFLDVKENLYPTMKQYTELNTPLGTINLKIDDWANAEGERKELLNRWDDTYHLDMFMMYYR
jgi:hypothetical protein